MQVLEHRTVMYLPGKDRADYVLVFAPSDGMWPRLRVSVTKWASRKEDRRYIGTLTFADEQEFDLFRDALASR